MSIHQVSHFDLRDFGALTIRVGDLNRDGAPDFLWVQSHYLTRKISCLTATTIHGDILWQQGDPDKDNFNVYSDLPVQIYDWDGDGYNEVLWVEQARYAVPLPRPDGISERAEQYEGNAILHILDGATGEEKARRLLPAPADDALLFADLTGSGRRRDFVVKDRYWNMWGVAHDGTVLWHWAGSTGHCPAIADVDNDGCDEVFVGYALIDHDGRVLFEHDAGGSHQDAACITQLPGGEWRLLFGNGGLHCLDVSGATLWHVPLKEAQHVLAAPFNGQGTSQIAVIDRGQPLDPQKGRRGGCSPATLLLYDMDGHELWRREQPQGSWCAHIVDVRWQSPAQAAILVAQRGQGLPLAIIDGNGDTLEEFHHFKEAADANVLDAGHYTVCDDLWGDSREEVLLFDGKEAFLYANSNSLPIPKHYNHTYYRGN